MSRSHSDLRARRRKPPPLVYVHDNPDTMRRECWQDGRLVASYCFSVILSRSIPPGRGLFHGAEIGPWEEGQSRGDARAMEPSDRPAPALRETLVAWLLVTSERPQEAKP